MQNYIYGIGISAAVLALVAGCASVAPVDHLKTGAILTAGDIVSYSGSAGSGPRVSIVKVDGNAVDKPYGPIELSPGVHEVTMKCDNSITTNTITAVTGEVYQFMSASPGGGKGCVASLTRLRSAHP
jgi:hypothetical protein